MILELLLALWAGILALQIVDVVLTASRLPQLSEFAAVRTELLEAPGRKLTTEDIENWREQIAALDARELARSVPAGRSASVQLWRFSPWRLIPAVLAVGHIGFVAALPSSPVAVILALPLPVIAYVLALAAARASVAAASARASVHEAQREEIEQLLDTVSRASRKRVAGLGERVNRALQILREQQD